MAPKLNCSSAAIYLSVLLSRTWGLRGREHVAGQRDCRGGCAGEVRGHGAWQQRRRRRCGDSGHVTPPPLVVGATGGDAAITFYVPQNT